MKPNKLRLLITEKCNRNCPGCCNKQWDLSKLPIETDFTGYEMIILTGGEPMLEPELVIRTAAEIGRQNPMATIIMYTAKTDDWATLAFVLSYLDGITVTMHDQSDVIPFCVLESMIPDKMIGKSLRLNVFSNVDMVFNSSYWEVKDNIEWIADCPLPEGEVFKRL